MKSFTELDVWKTSKKLVNWIYGITKLFPRNEIFGLVNQMRRCAVSIPSNIAEGTGRQHAKDSIQFYFVSRGSLYELETQLYICLDQNYITEKIFNEGLEKITSCKKLLNGFIKYYKTLNPKN